jgi:hypothetical protein
MLQHRPHLSKVHKKYQVSLSLGCIALRINKDGVMHADKAGERATRRKRGGRVCFVNSPFDTPNLIKYLLIIALDKCGECAAAAAIRERETERLTGRAAAQMCACVCHCQQYNRFDTPTSVRIISIMRTRCCPIKQLGIGFRLRSIASTQPFSHFFSPNRCGTCALKLFYT